MVKVNQEIDKNSTSMEHQKKEGEKEEESGRRIDYVNRLSQQRDKNIRPSQLTHSFPIPLPSFSSPFSFRILRGQKGKHDGAKSGCDSSSFTLFLSR